MLGVILKLLSILGIAFLALLLLVLLALGLVLLFPFSYRVSGEADSGGFRLSVRVDWLFGLFRIRFRYPEPGRLQAKLLFFSLLDGRRSSERSKDRKKVILRKKGIPWKKGIPQSHRSTGTESAQEPRGSAAPEGGCGKASAGREETGRGSAEDSGPSGRVSRVAERLQCYCDKTKEVWKNVSYYAGLMQEEETERILGHIVKRAKMVLRSVRPRRAEGEICFGTGSPDITGYLYGIYCMLSAFVRSCFVVTPDFEEKRFEGAFDVAGRIVAWVLLVNGLALVLDRRLRPFLRKLRAGRKKKVKR